MSTLQLTDGSCHGIEALAHLTSQGGALVLMFPRGEDEKPPLGAGLVVLVSWPGKTVEAPGAEEDEWQLGFECRSHHGLLSF